MISGKTRSPIPDQDTTQSVKMANRVQTAQIATAKVKFPQESRRARKIIKFQRIIPLYSLCVLYASVVNWFECITNRDGLTDAPRRKGRCRLMLENLRKQQRNRGVAVRISPQIKSGLERISGWIRISSASKSATSAALRVFCPLLPRVEPRQNPRGIKPIWHTVSGLDSVGTLETCPHNHVVMRGGTVPTCRIGEFARILRRFGIPCLAWADASPTREATPSAILEVGLPHRLVAVRP